jgi:hypothetical protein
MSANSSRDYYVSTLAVLHSQRRSIARILEDMSLRLAELEDELIHDMDDSDTCKQDNLVEYAWNEGYEYANFEHNKIIWNDEENDDIIYDSARNKKPECMCDECWGVKSDAYEHRMD